VSAEAGDIGPSFLTGETMFSRSQLIHLLDLLEAAQESYQEDFPVKFDEFDGIMIGQDGLPVFEDPAHSEQYAINEYCLIKVSEEIEYLESFSKNYDISELDKKLLQRSESFLVAIDDSGDISEEDIKKFREQFHVFMTRPSAQCDCGGHKVKVPCRHWCSTQGK
jgi:hypothetical protein